MCAGNRAVEAAFCRWLAGRERTDGMDTSVAVSLTFGAVAALAWLFRLEGRINGHDQMIAAIREDLHYVRSRIDRALNGRLGGEDDER